MVRYILIPNYRNYIVTDQEMLRMCDFRVRDIAKIDNNIAGLVTHDDYEKV